MPARGDAEVVRDDVGIRLQLRLHPPLLGDVVEEHDQPVADPCDAMQERAEHVAVAEGRVVRHLVDEGVAGVAHLDVDREGPAVAHRGQRLEQRVALGGLRRDPEAAHHGRVAVAECEVDDRPGGVADRPQEPDRLREALEQRAEPVGTARAEDLDERRVLAPGLRLELVVQLVHARRIRALLTGGRHRHAPGTIRTCDLCLRRAALYPLSYGRGEGRVYEDACLGPSRAQLARDTRRDSSSASAGTSRRT